MPAAAATPADDQHEVEAQRQPLAQRQQLEAEEHREGDDRGDVKAADRQEVGKPAAAHRVGIVLIHRILVAGDERDGDPRRLSRAGAARCGAAAPSRDAVEPVRLRRDARTVTGPSGLPTAPIPWNQASRAKS